MIQLKRHRTDFAPYVCTTSSKSTAWNSLRLRERGYGQNTDIPDQTRWIIYVEETETSRVNWTPRTIERFPSLGNFYYPGISEYLHAYAFCTPPEVYPYVIYIVPSDIFTIGVWDKTKPFPEGWILDLSDL